MTFSPPEACNGPSVNMLRAPGVWRYMLHVRIFLEKADWFYPLGPKMASSMAIETRQDCGPRRLPAKKLHSFIRPISRRLA